MQELDVYSFGRKSEKKEF